MLMGYRLLFFLFKDLKKIICKCYKFGVVKILKVRKFKK